MDLASVLASRRRIAESSAVTSEGLGIRKVAEGKPSAESSRAALLAFGSQPKRADCGYVGLLNQGATCYLNSLLQVLYCMGDFRKVLFEWTFDETIHGEAKRSLTRQLQELFAQLQLAAKAAVGTGKLTKSFGWDGDQAFVQNDVHECMAVLMDAIQTETFGSAAHDFVKTMHTGRMEHHTTCLGCHTTSVRPDDFTSLLLPVRGATDLYSSLKMFLTEETLSGDNKYACEVCGSKQDAIRAPKIPSDTLPNNLFIQLNRFEFDYNTMTRKKAMDKVSPPLHLDLGPYLLDADAAKSRAEYELFAVLMHTGAATAGHYFAYILTDSGWLQFNDAVVSPIPEDQLARALGQTTLKEGEKPADVKGGAGAVPNVVCTPGTPEVGGEAKPQMLAQDASVGAYMLVYRKKSQLGSLMNDASASVPPDLVEKVMEENEGYLAARSEWEAEQRRARLRIYFRAPDVLCDAVTDTNEFVLDSDALSAGDMVIGDDATVEQLIAASIDAIGSAHLPTDEPSADVKSRVASLFHDGLLRVRAYNALKGLAMNPIVADESRACVRDFGLVSGKSLLLERRRAGDEWPIWIDGCLPLKLVVFNPDTATYFPAVPLLLPKEAATVGKMRECAVAAVARWPIAQRYAPMGQALRVRLILLQVDSEKPAIVLHDDATAVIETIPLEGVNAVKLVAGDVLHAELCPLEGIGSDPKTAEGSRVVEMWDQNVNTVTITFNKPSGIVNDALDSTLAVQVDQRLRLQELKEAISHKLGIPPTEIKVRRSLDSPEFKDVSASLAFYGFQGGGSVHVELGRPLEPHEYEFKLSFASGADETGKPTYLQVAQVVLSGQQSGSEAKAVIARCLHSLAIPEKLDLTAWPTPPFMRLREKPLNASKLGRVIVDDKPLAWSYGGKLADGKDLVVQVTAFEEVVREGDILLTVLRWDPVKSHVYTCAESVFSTSMPMREFAKALMQRASLDAATLSVKIAKPWAWQLHDPLNLWHIKWVDVDLSSSESSASTVNDMKLALKTGDQIVITRAVDFNDITAPGKPETKDADDTNTGAATTSKRVHVPEQAFKIYSAAEQLVREEAKREEEERQKQENDERAAAVQAALAARRESAASLATADGSADAAAVTGPERSSATDEALSVSAPAGMEKFVRLLQLGMSADLVKARMQVEGVDPNTLPL